MGSRLENNSTTVRKRIESHTFSDEGGEEYSASAFGGFADYMRRKKIKLQNLDAELRSRSTGNPPIFKNVVAHVNGYTQPSLADLHKMIVSYGGGFLQYLDGKTAATHVIAGNLTPKKKVEFARYRVVRPAWVVDSIKDGRMLPWERYRVADEGVGQKVLGFEGKMVSQKNELAKGYREQTDSSWYTGQLKDIARDVDGGVGNPEAEMQNMLLNGDGRSAVAASELLHEKESESLSQENESNFPFDGPEVAPQDQEAIFAAYKSNLNSEDSHAELNSRPGLLVIAPNPRPELQTGGMSNNMNSAPTTEIAGSPEKRQLTAEEHNARLLSNPHMAKSSTANPDFLNQYYRESRLHHLSTWKAELKSQLQARAVEKMSSQKPQHKRPLGARRYIMHVDFDSFFASVSLRKYPELASKPVAIAHGSGPGSEIASCNYPARAFGIKNGMWMKSALQLCPAIKVLPYDFKAYEEASRHFYDSVLSVDGIVQSISIDEALVDVSQQCIEAGGSDGKAIQESSIYREQAKANELAQRVRSLVEEKTGCEVSVGIGSNILLAKVALRKAKPAGQYLIKPEEVLDFVGELTVTDLPGVAWSIGNKLEDIGVKFVKDIRNITKERLINSLGPKTGDKLWDYSRGIDKAEVGEQVIRKSVSTEINWGIRFITQQQAEDFVQCLCDELHKRLLEQSVKGRQMTMKIMRKAADAGMDPPKNLGHGKCDTFNKSVVLGVATNDKEVLGKEAISILRGYGFSPGELRGLGVQMQKLEPLRPLPSAKPEAYDSSQRRLQFKKPAATMTPSKLNSYELNSGEMVLKHARPSPRLKDTLDPIEEMATLEKPSDDPKIMGVLDSADSLRGPGAKQKPLNVTGTQFLLPTQIDPTVIAELPADIRSKLAPKQKQTIDSLIKVKPKVEESEPKSRSASPFPIDSDYALPNQSQIDPEILQALPDNVREELLAYYKTTGARSGAGLRSQQVLPQSPRRARTIASTKKLVLTPTEKQKTSSLFSRGKSKTNLNTTSTLTQSNFVSVAKASTDQADSTAGPLEDISQSFLDELPEDIRLEILAEQKRNRLKSKAGLSIGANRKKIRHGHDIDSVCQRTIQLPPRPEKPTFTSRKLSTLSELREAMSAWVEEFSEEGEEGPFEEDVNALNDYLSKVVTVERDLEKAVAIVEWVMYLVADHKTENLHTRDSWTRTVSTLQSGVQAAIKDRGLPPVNFVER